MKKGKLDILHFAFESDNNEIRVHLELELLHD